MAWLYVVEAMHGVSTCLEKQEVSDCFISRPNKRDEPAWDRQGPMSGVIVW